MSKRLSANERARILSNHEKGIEDPNYYVLKTKTGVLNIRRKKVKFDEPASSEETSKDESSKEEMITLAVYFAPRQLGANSTAK